LHLKLRLNLHITLKLRIQVRSSEMDQTNVLENKRGDFHASNRGTQGRSGWKDNIK